MALLLAIGPLPKRHSKRLIPSALHTSHVGWKTSTPPPFWQAQYGKPGKVDRWQIIRFEAPCTITIDVGVAAAGTGAKRGDRSQGVNGYVLNTITPSTDKTCLYFWAFARNYDLNNQARTHTLREGVAGVFREDEAVLEAQQQAIDANPDHDFYNLNIDAGSMWARRLIDGLVERERPRVPTIPIVPSQQVAA